MTVNPGTRLGPYEIVSRLGAGGMGEVWSARDTRLERSVAVKILPSEFAQNAQLKIRFEREAKTISQLSHPNICTLFDVGENEGLHYLVMELMDGESLADRLSRGPLPLAEVLRHGREIAEALARAHKQGVVHRDLKPGNVMLTKAGAKLLDFGLSKAVAASPAANDATEHKPLTQEGTVVGTFQYMAPEQVAGEEADHRSDIFALGVVLYEMATGQRAFAGQTRTSLIAAIVGGEPRPLRELQPLTPPALEHLIAKCMEKDPERRWQSAHDIAEELRWIQDAGSQAGVAAPLASVRRSRERVAWSLAAILTVLLAALAFQFVKVRREDTRPFVANIAPPTGFDFNAVGDESGAAVISPDGKWVAFSITDGTAARLCLRSLTTGEVRVLDGTANAMFPFWSPDSRKVGFATYAGLKYVDIDGGAPVAITNVSGARGATWGPDGTIVFTPATLDPIYRVPVNGGKPVAVTTIDSTQHSSHRWPSFLPDGKRFLFLATNHQDTSGSTNAVYVASVDGGPSRLVMRTVSNAIYHDGHLFFTRDRSLFAQAVDGDLRPKGEPVRVADNVLYDGGVWRTAFSISDTGVLLFHTGQLSTRPSTLQWVDRTGKVLEEVGPPDLYFDMQLSPDRRRLIVVMGDPHRALWLYELERKVRTKLSSALGFVGTGIWSPDGSTVYFDARRGDGFAVVARRLNGGERILAKLKGSLGVADVSPDGRTLFLEDVKMLRTLSLDPPSSEPKPAGFTTPIIGTSVSPNGRWLAHESLENGRSDVIVVSRADPTVRWQISPNGGWGARWRPDGRELYFVDMDNRLTAVPVQESGDDLEIGTPQTLFPVRFRLSTRAYVPSVDGTRFLVNMVMPQPSPMIVIFRKWDQAAARGND